MADFDPAQWLGRTEEVHDQLSRNLVRRIAATFDVAAPGHGEELPLLWHWCFFQEPVDSAGLGSDGHPALGGFMPPAHGRNRMWAGGRLEFLAPLRVGEEACRTTRIAHIEEKNGRSGSLLFVTLHHEYRQGGRLAIREEQDIVYREPSPPKLADGEPLPEAQWREAIQPDPVLLFRYSAVTFNAHRIHYDWPYVTEAEGYPGLVVHGPLTATLNLAAFVKAHPARRPKRFSFRGVRPLIAPAAFEVGGRSLEPGVAELWAGNASGLCQQARIEYE
ncbi:MaoC family dehydratase N-terminal domain-containing protein [Pseudomonas sp. RIT-PI-AD]|uniref:FAS1-like dehydratase domain-containing protein n=1 Tax=Pseudomonas sp. RIT-PI-AD TaxID=3035294 RepID=UPI0021D94350|nr:MaoC family dehydratase N-terminal domain-containing protein [Pseudomonas sp. RIT-PI-AD]